MGGWLRRLNRIFLTPPIYFAVVATGWTLMSLPLRVDTRTILLPIGLGFLAAHGLFALRLRFIRLYVFGHELTHWFAAKLFRRRTGRFEVGRRGGSVEVENPNTLIVLAPYFVPVYTLAWIGAYGIVRLFIEPIPTWGVMLFGVGLGATYAFHLVLTWLSLKAGQEDLRLCGPIFSVGVILLGNLLLIFLTLTVAGRLWGIAFAEWWKHTTSLWHLLWDGVTWIVHRLLSGNG